MAANRSIQDQVEKPSIAEFHLGKLLGEGNFSRLVVATHRETGEAFALKVIEKQRVKRLQIRHANILNEIQMEKEVLNRLRHPNIIRLYHTFQDNENLYFLLEYIQGGELLSQLMHDGRAVGLDEALARFYAADIVNAIEYMQSQQIVHRDLKPENMVVDSVDGHLRIVDFGTAKNLANTALNGPNFVGTPEYMAPETIDNKSSSGESDLWALGNIVYQLLTGETPFSGGSAYLTFLNVQRGRFTIPSFLSDAAKDFIVRLLQPDASKRLTISQVKEHGFFEGVDFEHHMKTNRPQQQFANEQLFALVETLREVEKQRQSGARLEFNNDPVQRQIEALDANDMQLVMHLLKRKQILHLPGVYPRFFETPAQGRCQFARDGGYVGFTHELQNEWTNAFSVIVMRDMYQNRDFRSHLQFSLSAINQKKPAFLVVFENATEDADEALLRRERLYQFVDEINADIKLVFVPGLQALGQAPSETCRKNYRKLLGEDSFSFWFGGVKFIVINSTLIVNESIFTASAKQQEDWLAKELDNGRLCARETILFSAHTFHTLVSGPARPPQQDESIAVQQVDTNISGAISNQTRKRYTDMIAQHTPRLVVTADGPPDQVHTLLTTQSSQSSDEDAASIRKTEIAGCNSALHILRFSQSGLSLERHDIQAEPTAVKAPEINPEDIEIRLASEASAQ